MGEDEKDGALYSKLHSVQQTLKAPKDQEGRFGKHRSAEGILKALKPVLKKEKLSLVLTDKIVNIGNRNYVKASAVLIDSFGNQISSDGYAWEGEIARGLDASQITGATSSYARKYALNGLFAIDDTADADSNNHPNAHKSIVSNTLEPKISHVQLSALFAMMKSKQFDDRKQVERILRNFAGVESLTMISKKDASQMIDDLKNADHDKLLEFNIEEVKEANDDKN